MITDDILNGLYDSDIEKWKLISKTNNLYAVSTSGRIMSMRDGRIMKTTISNKGYELVITHVDGKQKGYTVHRLVAEAFISNPNGYKEINHKDENKANNCSDNLEWCNHLYNQNYGTLGKRVGTIRKKKIRCIESGIIYDSLTEASKAMSVCSTAINNCLKKRSKTCCGYTWEYVDV